MPDRFPIRRSSWLALLGLAVVYLLMNLPLRYEEVYRMQSDQLGVNFWPTVGKPTYIAAGFPCTFYLDVGDSTPHLIVFHGLNLLFNLALLMLVLVLWGAYFVGKSKRKTNTAGAKARHISLADTLLLVTILAGCLGMFRMISGRVERDQQLALAIQQAGGRTTHSTMFPRVLKKLIPSAYSAKLARLSEVAIDSPSQEILVQVLERSQLRGLGLGGSTYDLRLLDRLASLPLLAELRVSGRELDVQALASIARAKQIQSLSLPHTNITSSALHALGEMPRLRYLDVEHTDIALSQLGTPSFFRQIEELHLPRPELTHGDDLTLEGWEQLRVLRCDDRVAHRNRAVVRLRLHNLPKLERVELDPLQKYDLDFSQLPKLKSITAFCENERDRMPGRYVVYHFPWARQVKLEGIPALTLLRLQVNGLETIEIVDATNLDLEIGSASEIDYSRWPDRILKPELEWRQGWVNSLRSAKGPNSLSIVGVSMEGVDFSPLSQQKFLRKIKLNYNRLGDEQLATLKDLPNLETLELLGNSASGATIERIVKSCPSLRSVQAHPEYIRRIRLEHHASIEKLFISGGEVIFLDGLRLIDVPNLAERFDLPPMVRHLHIDQAPRLVGLTTREPWPEKAVLRGVKNLNYFAGGGPFLNDAVVESLLECKSLQKLTLAYSKTSRESLEKLGTLAELEYLALPSSLVDDGVVQQWRNLVKLKALILDDAPITDNSLEVIGNMTQLENLSLARTKVTAAGLTKLNSLTSISRISLAGIEMNSEVLTMLGSWNQLTEIDLSDTSMGSTEWSAFVKACPPYVAKLTLKRAKVDSPSLKTLANRFVGMKFDFEDADVETALELQLLERQRVIVPEEEDNLGFWRMGGVFADPRGESKSRMGEVDPRFFRPMPKN